ncbi:ketose-bisphosphate aldolase [Chloroflexota bacterium]
MIVSTKIILKNAREEGCAIGAFNVYDMQGAMAVVKSAEELRSPIMLQILPKALEMGSSALIALCLEAARSVQVPVAVQLDHCSSAEIIELAIQAGVSGVMADGSHLPYEENVSFTRQITALAHSQSCTVEAELGRLTGVEDGLTVAAYESLLTSPGQAEEFAASTDIDSLAVCIGNIHGKYLGEPNLDFERLKKIRHQVSIPLVLHGTSGLPDDMIRRSIQLGVCKFNVNTEVRDAYTAALKNYFTKNQKYELMEIICQSIDAMKGPIRSKIQLFGSVGHINTI